MPAPRRAAGVGWCVSPPSSGSSTRRRCSCSEWVLSGAGTPRGGCWRRVPHPQGWAVGPVSPAPRVLCPYSPSCPRQPRACSGSSVLLQAVMAFAAVPLPPRFSPPPARSLSLSVFFTSFSLKTAFRTHSGEVLIEYKSATRLLAALRTIKMPTLPFSSRQPGRRLEPW